MVAAHSLIRRATLVALTTLFLASGCSRDAEPEAEDDSNTITREGVNVEFPVQPIHGGVDEVAAGEWADVTFKVTDATTGEAIKGRYPAEELRHVPSGWDYTITELSVPGLDAGSRHAVLLRRA